MALVGRTKKGSKVDHSGVRRALAKMAICAELETLPKLDRKKVVRDLYTLYIENDVSK